MKYHTQGSISPAEPVDKLPLPFGNGHERVRTKGTARRDPVTGQNQVFDYKTFEQWAKEKGLKRNKYGNFM